MLIMNDDKLDQFGVLTRAKKGWRLTHEELDKNIATAMDIMAFRELCNESYNEYPAILNAKTAVEGDNLVQPINGYCAIKFPAELAGMQVEAYIDDGKWVYKNGFSEIENLGSSDVYFADPDSVLVFRASDEEHVTVSATSYGYGYGG